jgi:dihydroflavonol-4-reductase
MSTVLVTGGSGFVGSHIVLQLLNAGHNVRTTVRSAKKEESIREMLRTAGDPGRRLTVFSADLTGESGWPEAVAGCDCVIHVASPLSDSARQTEAEVIASARDGSLRVLRAAREAGVRRVVMTSSCGAVYYGYPPRAEPFDETNWSNPDRGDMSAYVKSKLMAERAAWDFVRAEGGGLELAVINPAGIFGPVLTPDASSSTQMVKRLLAGMPGCPRIHFAIVDVRDVADLHIRAMSHPGANGERFVAVAENGSAMSMLEMADVLRARLGDAATKAPTRELPDWVVRAGAIFDPAMRQLLPMLGKVRNATSAKAQRVLGWKPRPREDALVATAESLLKFGIV